MGKPTPPQDPPAVPGGAARLSQGLAAYRRTLHRAPDPAEPSPGAGPVPAAAEPGAGEAAPGFLKSVRTGGAGRPPKARPSPAANANASGDAAGESKFRRVAKFLILIGGEEASRILSTLDEDQVEAVLREVASIRGIGIEEGEAVLAEFRSLLSGAYAYAGRVRGGVEEARRLLYAAFGPERGEDFLRRTLPGVKEEPFAFLDIFSGEQVHFLIKEEAPTTAALILARLAPKRSAGVLSLMPPERKSEIVRRIAEMGPVSPEVLKAIASALQEKARHISAAAGKGLEMDGKSALAAILRSSDLSFGDRILGELEDLDEELGRDLKERLYTLEDVVKAGDRVLQEKIRTMTERDIVLLIKGRSGSFREKILSNVSSQRRSLILEEEEFLGPALKRDVDNAARDFLAWFRLNREEGRITLIDDEDLV